MHGLVGTLSWSPSAALYLNERGSAKLIEFTSASHREYLIRTNERMGGVDVFVHSWNPELASLIDSAYSGTLRDSLHEPPVYADKARSQALSLARAAKLMRAHEHQRGQSYALAFVLRFDAFVAAPFDLTSLQAGHLWFSELCCTRDAVTSQEQALVLARCGAGTCNMTTGSCSNYRKGQQFRRRLLGSCTPDIYSHGRQLKRPHQLNNAYMIHDWWFAASSEVVAGVAQVEENWEWLMRRRRELNLPAWSHHLWPLLIHEVLNLTSTVRFKAGVRIGLARHVFERARTGCSRDDLSGPCHKPRPLGNYYADAVGFCDVLQPYNSTGESEPVLRRERWTRRDPNLRSRSLTA